MPFDREKFKALVYYICWRCVADPSRLGAVKLNKALWLADLKAYLELGKPITGARYIKRQLGPVPAAILPVLKELQSEGRLEVRDTTHFDKAKKEFIALHGEPGDFMTDEEKEIADAVIGLVCDRHTAASISAVSHNHIWQVAKDGEEIPHFTVFATPGEVTDEDYAWALEQVGQAATVNQ